MSNTKLPTRAQFILMAYHPFHFVLCAIFDAAICKWCLPELRHYAGGEKLPDN